jgi:tRNA U34 5-carboxymethylaminomethyl modifying GTPase MnmE/TrmE
VNDEARHAINEGGGADLDTPGLGANARDDKVTLDSLHLADAAILVVNGLQPGGEDSLTLSERLRTTQRKLVTVVTRIDLTSNPSDALDAAKTVFGAVADGDPIGVASPVIMKALDLLKAADEKRDQDGLKAANELLRTSGYFALRERLQEGCFAGQAAAARASRTIADLRSMLHRLELQAAQEAGRTQKKADEIASELSAAQRHINEVLRLNNGNRTKTARDLDVDPRTIFRHLEKERDDDETGEPSP